MFFNMLFIQLIRFQWESDDDTLSQLNCFRLCVRKIRRNNFWIKHKKCTLYFNNVQRFLWLMNLNDF